MLLGLVYSRVISDRYNNLFHSPFSLFVSTHDLFLSGWAFCVILISFLAFGGINAFVGLIVGLLHTGYILVGIESTKYRSKYDVSDFYSKRSLYFTVKINILCLFYIFRGIPGFERTLKFERAVSVSHYSFFDLHRNYVKLILLCWA